MDPNVLARKQLPELKSLAAELQMRGYQRLRKADLIDAIVREANRRADPNQRGDASNGAQPSDDAPLALAVTDSRVRASASEPVGGDPNRRHVAATAWRLSAPRSTFPRCVRGRSSTKTIVRGCL